MPYSTFQIQLKSRKASMLDMHSSVGCVVNSSYTKSEEKLRNYRSQGHGKMVVQSDKCSSQD